MENTKRFWESKTFWFNVAMSIVDISAALTEVVPAEWLPYLMLVQTIGNIVIRRFTSTPMTF